MIRKLLMMFTGLGLISVTLLCLSCLSLESLIASFSSSSGSGNTSPTSTLEHKLDVPFESQWARNLASPYTYPKNGQNGGDNCGPASLTMVLHYYGKNITFEQVVPIVRAHRKTGFTDFESADYKALLKDHGLDFVRDSLGGILNMGSFSDIKAQIDLGRPVIMSVFNEYGRTALYDGVDGMVASDVNDNGTHTGVNHIVVLTGYRVNVSGDLQTVYINDPLAITNITHVADPRKGKDFTLTSDQFTNAVSHLKQKWYGAAVYPASTVDQNPSAPAAKKTVYNAANDFSIANNPNGVWSYGYEAKIGSAFVLYKANKVVRAPGLDAWTDSSLGTDPCVIHNRTNSPITFTTVTEPANALSFHPGSGGQFGIIRWTAPADGSYQIKVTFTGFDFNGPTTTDVHVLHNSAAIFNGIVSAYKSGPSFDGNISTLKGDTIDFVVGVGENKSYWNDTTGIDATIVAYDK
jgi:hypothetical protein